MEVDNMDFDVMSYLNLSDDNLSSICEDFDFDLDAILGYEGDNASDGFTPTDAQQDVIVNDGVLRANSDSTEVSFNSNSPDSNESYHKRSHKIIVPVNKITADFKTDIKDISNALIVDLDKDAKHHSKYRRRLKSTSILETLLTSPQSLHSPQNVTRSQHAQQNAQKKDKEWLKALARFAHQNGSYISPKADVSDHSNNKYESEKTQIHHVNVDWKSYCLMKSICKGNIENYVCQKGNILLPKVQDSLLTNSKNHVNTSILNRNNGTASLQICQKTMDSTLKRADEFGKTFEHGGWTVSEIQEDHSNFKISKNADSAQDKNYCNLKDHCKNLSDLSNYPQFRIRYLISMQHRLRRIDCLPLPICEVDLDINNSVTEDEKLIMREFFKNHSLTSRYIQIRNHILKCWKLNKPGYTSKTFVRYGLRNHGDVNVLGLVHRYLERIGAINFGCKLVHYAAKKEKSREIFYNKCT